MALASSLHKSNIYYKWSPVTFCHNLKSNIPQISGKWWPLIFYYPSFEQRPLSQSLTSTTFLSGKILHFKPSSLYYAPTWLIFLDVSLEELVLSTFQHIFWDFSFGCLLWFYSLLLTITSSQAEYAFDPDCGIWVLGTVAANQLKMLLCYWKSYGYLIIKCMV